MKSFLSGLFLIFSLPFTGHAQRICGATDYKQQILSSDFSLKEVFQQIEKQVLTVKNKSKSAVAMRGVAVDEIIYIPVVIHLLYKNAAENISDAQVKSQLNVLNKDFNRLNSDTLNTPAVFKSFAGDARIKFCLAQLDPQGKKTNGIERKYTSQDFFKTDDGMKMAAKGGMAAWDSKRYLNIWVCNLSSSCLGYGTPPGADADKDGVVIAYNAFGTIGNLSPIFNKGRTATHEIGHWLGLIHTWGDENCGDDKVDDTPAQQSYNYGCETFPKLSNCSPNSNGDMFMNFMDFSDDACMNIFTKGQVIRMRALFAQNGIRNSFLTSFACDSVLAGAIILPVSEEASVRTVSTTSARVYPNPVHSATTIECNTATALTTKTINIFNITGVKVFTARLIQEKTVLNFSNLVTGIYIIQIEDDEHKFTTRIIKQ